MYTSKQSSECDSGPAGHLLTCLQLLQLWLPQACRAVCASSPGVPSVVILGVTMAAAEKWQDATQSRRNAAGERRRRGISCLLTPAACLKATLIVAFMAWTALRLAHGDILITIDEDHAVLRVWYLTGMAVRQALWTSACAA